MYREGSGSFNLSYESGLKTQCTTDSKRVIGNLVLDSLSRQGPYSIYICIVICATQEILETTSGASAFE
mgnify:CR=1 FL=1|jgi:hypothetical protein